MVDNESRAAQVLAELARHPSLRDIALQDIRPDGAFTVTAAVQVPLPGRAMATGYSASGVLAVEPCTFVFAPTWPVRGPRVFLRTDFPLNLPHINPHREGAAVSPCLFEGSMDEVFHRFGMDAVIDQLVEWLTKAASGQLIDEAQGWEPSRRDHHDGLVIFESHALTAAIASSAIGAYAIDFMAHAGYFHGQFSGHDAIDLGAFRYQATAHNINGQSWMRGKSVALVAHCPVEQWEQRTFGEYFPDTVTDLPSLLAAAERYGVERDALERTILDFFRDQDMLLVDVAKERELFAQVVLAVRRPVHLVSDRERKVEFLPYFLRYVGNIVEKVIEVRSVWHAYAPSPKVLQSAAGMSGVDIGRHIVLAGCGSLGSKIGMHLGRSGFGHITFIDDDWMSPHNMARHALLVKDFAVPALKAERMVEAFAALSHSASKAHVGDFTSVLADEADFQSTGCDQAALIIDATASLTVMAAELSSPLLAATPARLVRTLMYGQGRCTATLIEGPGRSSRMDDLTALFFNACRTDAALRRALAGAGSDSERIMVGDNCSSMTTPMSDSVISRSAALAGRRVERLLRDGAPDSGIVGFGVSDDFEMGIAWHEIAIGATTVMSCALGNGWTIRVPEPVVAEIEAEAKRWGNMETGGALIGHLVEATKTIVIGGVIEAPPDSTRAPNRFVLGTQGLVPALTRAHQDSVGHLHFIGTWHSHPMGGGHSSLDQATLQHLADIAPDLPMVSLVWTPEGLVCAVGRRGGGHGTGA